MEGSLSSPMASSWEGGSLVEDILAIIVSIKGIRDYRKTQRNDCLILVTRIKHLLPFLREIRNLEATAVPEPAIVSLTRLKKALQSAKKLLKLCHGGSKIYLALESGAMMVRLHNVSDKLGRALEGMPYQELRISEEQREQIELLHKQLNRAKDRKESQDMELAMVLMVALSTNNGDRASLERLANVLHLRTHADLKEETVAIQKLVKERKGKGRNSESTEQVVKLLNKFRRLAGIPELDLLDDPDSPKPIVESSLLMIPNEFLCPITSEIMTDPVIIATGLTYQRESIQQWLDSNNHTCPKTGQALEHLLPAPNVALKNLIQQWCDKNGVQLPKKKICASTTEEVSSTTDKDKISSLIQSLSSSNLDEQREAIKSIRMLSKESPENRMLIANAGGIPHIVQILSYPDSIIQEHAVTALLNLSIDETNKLFISEGEAIPLIIDILRTGTVGAKENSAAALFSLSMINGIKAKIAELNGIPALVDLLETGTVRGKKDAIAALFNLCLNPCNKTRAIEAGVLPPLLKALSDKTLEMVNEILSMLLILASCPAGRRELGQLSFIETLVNIIQDDTPKHQEFAAAVLLELGLHNHNLMLAALQYGVYEPLYAISKSGTERGQRKAKAILQLMARSEEIPIMP